MTEDEARMPVQQQQPARIRAPSVGGGVAQHITEECERLFCGRLRAAFLGERSAAAAQDSLVVGVHPDQQHRPAEPGARSDGKPLENKIVRYLEMYDYRGDTRFRGFVSHSAAGDRTMFVFFEPNLAGKDLKAGLMALLELAYEKAFNCAEMVVCLDRGMAEEDLVSTTRDLGWVGFEMTTLEPWSRSMDDTSRDWILLAMET